MLMWVAVLEFAVYTFYLSHIIKSQQFTRKLLIVKKEMKAFIRLLLIHLVITEQKLYIGHVL